MTDPDKAYRYKRGMLIIFEKEWDESLQNIEVYHEGKHDKSYDLANHISHTENV